MQALAVQNPRELRYDRSAAGSQRSSGTPAAEVLQRGGTRSAVKTQIRVASSGVSAVRPDGQRSFIAWAEVREICHRDMPGRIEFRDGEGKRRLVVLDVLENRSEFLRLVQERTGLRAV